MEQAFQYKWEEQESLKPSSSKNESSFLLLFWICFFLVCFMSLFLFGYKKFNSTQQTNTQSLHAVGMEPFLVRILNQNGLALTKVNVQFFVEDIRVQHELLKDQAKYKELLIFFLSNSKTSDFSDEFKKKDLQEKIKNHVNSFLSTGRVQNIEINHQFI
ncbi:MAG: flagellar basal body-associated FliL family protein [Bdellovibrionales bacterium]|nr:flagellar basal body-associated FliL family protein [Bdellovibrionales bacterium]